MVAKPPSPVIYVALLPEFAEIVAVGVVVLIPTLPTVSKVIPVVHAFAPLLNWSAKFPVEGLSTPPKVVVLETEAVPVTSNVACGAAV